ERMLVAPVEVLFEARPVVKTEVLEPADVRRPGSEVEAAQMRPVEAALDGRLAAGLRDAAKAVLAEQDDIGGQRIVGRRCGGNCGRRCGWGRRGLRQRRARDKR